MVLGKIIRARRTRGQARHAMDRGRRGPLAALRLGFGAVLIGLLSLGGVIAPAHAAAGEVDLVKTLDSVQEGGNTTDVFQTGGLVRYTLKLSCLSMTTECVTGTITDVLDPNLEFVQVYRPQESDSFTSTAGYDAGSRTVTIVAGSEAKPFRGGDTAEFVVVARVKSFPANNLVPGDPTHGIIPNQASALPKDGETPRVSDIVEIRVPKPTPNWNVGKRTSTTTTGVGETVIYEVRLTVPDTALQGNVDLQSATVVDHYPAGATVVDADGGVVNTVDRTITWTVPALTVAQMAATCSPFLWDGLCISASWVKRPKLAFPTTHFANGDVVTNEVDASFTFVDGTTGTGEDEVDVRLVTGTVSAQFGKTGPSTASLGQLVSWNHFYYNNGTVAVPGVTIEDPAIPAGLTNLLVRVAISAGNSWTLEVKENDAWTSQSGVGSIGGGLPLPEGAQAFRFTANWTVPVGGSVQLLLDATLAAGEVGDVLRNCATATPGSSAPSCYNTTIAVPKVRMRTAKAHLTTDPAGVKPGEEFRFGVAAKFFDGAAVDSGWVADALPPQFEYVATECVTQVGDVNWAGTNTGKQASFQQAVANCDPATAIEPTIGTTDVPVAGSTLLTWNDVPIQQAATGSTNITWVVFTVRVKPGTAVGSYTNTSYVGTDNALVYECISGSGVLVDHSDAKACKAEDPIIVQEAAVIDLTKWDKGPLPNVAEATGEESASCPDWEGFTRYPCVAQTPANGQFEYRFRMQNVGNINITDHVMYDILPYVGDTGVSQVLSAQNRGTQWRPVLTGPVVVESAPAAASPLIEYSLSSDPCRPEVAQGGADANWQGGGCSNDWLTAAQVTDWSAVKSFRVKSFQNGATWLPTQQIVLRVSMQAPDTALESVREPLNLSIAWNSTAHRAFRQNADGSTVRLLAAEPRKVGIIVPFPGVSVGDYVWLDGDRDGFQGGALDTPLKDITVTLKKKDASGVYQVVGTTTTDADGYYYFQYLDPGKEYSVTFSDIPAGLVPTIANAGGNSSNSATEDLNDSDAIDGVIEFVSPSTGDNLAAPGQADNPGLDAGYITPVVPVSIGDYVWFDTNRDGQQTAGEPVVPNVTVNLYAAGGTTPIRTTTTGPDGYYSFTGLDSSTPYTVEFVKPDGTTFTLQNTGADATDSDADRTTGRVEVTTPATGSNSGAPNQADDPTIDAGLLKYNLVLRKALQPGGPYVKDATATFTLTPSNDGPVDALAGWSVTDLLPPQLTLVSMSGTGYACVLATATCTASAPLAAGATGNPITVVATVNANISGTIRNVAYVAPAPGDVAETNPLVVPTNATRTTETPTDNDAEAELSVTALVSIGDYVWWDVNRDGQQTTGEAPVPGVTVNLYTENGTTPLQTTVTSDSGYYSFTGLTPSTKYRVEFVKPTGTEFTTRDTGADATDSDPDAAGNVIVTTPASGANSGLPNAADDPTIDAGLVKYNLVLRKALTSTGPVYRGSTVTFELTPSNDGPVNALAGWSVTDLLPEGMTLVSMTGTGYDCVLATATCTASAPLAAGATGAVITVTATVDTAFVGELVNIAYIAPSPQDIAETNPLVVPTGQTRGTEPTKTALTPTDNDAEAPVTTDSLVSIGDYVWIDVDRDGVQDEGEPIVEGVTVNLYAADGVTLVATTTTDDKGFYSFVDLVPGREYVVEFVKPDGYWFTDQNAGEDDTLDSDADIETGRVTVIAPASGKNSATDPDDPTIDAGLVRFNLSIVKTLVTTGVVNPGDTVVFTLVPHNDGPADALGGWSVTDLLPTGLTLVSMAGEGYACDAATATCLWTEPLAADSDGPVIVVTATVDAGVQGSLRNLAYVSPGPGEVPEDNPLEVPTKDTDTKESPTDNDGEAPLTVTPKLLPGLTTTGAVLPYALAGGGLLLLILGGIVLAVRRTRGRDAATGL